jgi:hypothetical protein
MAIAVLETGKVKSGLVAKVWEFVGGPQKDQLKGGTPVMGYREGEYFRLTGPVGGMTKTQWLDVAPITTPDPEPTDPDYSQMVFTVQIPDVGTFRATQWVRVS